MTKSRIQFDHQAFLEQRYGGVSRYFCEIATRVGKMDGYSTLVSAGLHVNEHLVPAQVRVVGSKVWPIKRTATARATVNRVLDHAAALAWRPRVMHETYYGRWRSAVASTKVVVTVHDLIHERYPAYFEADPTVVRRRWAMDRADALVCVSDATRCYLTELYPQHAHKARVIHHGQNFEEPSPKSLSDLDACIGQQPFVLYVGSRFGYKNFERLLNSVAAAWSAQSRPLLCCFGGGPLTTVELAQIDAAGLSPQHVKQFDGSDGILHAAYRKALAFVYPSLEEGFGIPLLEARAAGCRVACSDIPVFAEVLGTDAFYFDPRSVPAMTAALLDAVSAGADGQSAIAPKPLQFSWQRSAELHAQLYSSLV